MMSAAVKAEWAPAAAAIYQRLESDILDGLLPPDTVISEPVFSKRFGVSRAPLREAIWQLERHGLLVRPPRQRARVVTISLEKVHQIFALREALEGMAARQAAGRITPAALAELSATLARHHEQVAQAGHAGSADFHAAIAHVSGNEFIVRALAENYGLIELCRRRQRRSRQRNERSHVEHRRILAALEDGDADMAEMMMRRHVGSARTMIVQTLA